jgi:hypothetical protein
MAISVLRMPDYLQLVKKFVSTLKASYLNSNEHDFAIRRHAIFYTLQGTQSRSTKANH